MAASDFLLYDEASRTWREDPEQAVRDDVEKHYWLHVGRTILKDWRLYVMLLPMLLVFLFWRYFPMYELLGCFKVSDTVLPVRDQLFSGFSYFKWLLFSGDALSTDFWRAMRNTFLLSFYGLCFGFPMPIILALFFNEIRSNIVRSTCQVMTYLPKFMSTVVMTSLVTMLLKQGALIGSMGIVSQALVKLGLITQEAGQSGLLNNPAYFRAIYQISGIWEGAGYDSIVYFAAIIAISPTSYEAAQIDGANKWAKMRYVVLPCMLSTIVIMLITRIGVYFLKKQKRKKSGGRRYAKRRKSNGGHQSGAGEEAGSIQTGEGFPLSGSGRGTQNPPHSLGYDCSNAASVHYDGFVN